MITFTQIQQGTYPVCYEVYDDGELIGTITKDWYDTARTRTYRWTTEPQTVLWNTRQEAAEALRNLRISNV